MSAQNNLYNFCSPKSLIIRDERKKRKKQANERASERARARPRASASAHRNYFQFCSHEMAASSQTTVIEISSSLFQHNLAIMPAFFDGSVSVRSSISDCGVFPPAKERKERILRSNRLSTGLHVGELQQRTYVRPSESDPRSSTGWN